MNHNNKYDDDDDDDDDKVPLSLLYWKQTYETSEG